MEDARHKDNEMEGVYLPLWLTENWTRHRMRLRRSWRSGARLGKSLASARETPARSRVDRQGDCRADRTSQQ
eukprot:5161439-Pleurochrysis_carterae.AAC.1